MYDGASQCSAFLVRQHTQLELNALRARARVCVCVFVHNFDA